MKKIYTLAAAALLSVTAIAQTPFWTSTSYKGAFPVTDGLTGTTSNNWLAGWTNWDPENAVYPAPTTTISANITTNTTWTSGNTYLLVGNIAVTNNAVLTIQPGTVIRGDKNSKACLIISRGSQINAVGTVNNPIIFTSNEEPSGNGRAPADWGGVVLLGNGVVNTACATCATSPNQNYIEGFATNFNEILYGGNNNTESSGTMSYCRIEFAGVALSTTPNSELNSLTMGGVGSGTQIDHIQSSFGGDDAFEWFGGAVDAKYLVSFRGLDDDFDTDFGHSGRVQFGLVVRDKDISDAAGDSNGFESDNFNPGIGRLPITRTIFSNITVLGPKRDGTVALPSGEKFERGIFTRRNTAISVHNSIIVGWEKGWHVSGATTFDNYNANLNLDSAGVVQNVIIASNMFPKFVHDAGGANATWYNAYAGITSIDTTKTVAQIAFVNAFPTNLEDNSDFRLQASSTASTGASFSGPQFNGQVLGVKDLAKGVINSFVLYPNPATANTTISFNIAEKNKVSVNVYDVLGNLVSTLSQSNDFEKGNNTISLNTSNLASGIYYISLDINGSKETKKLVINK
ncbi:MAG: T9SS type A sorting domain-containing protein [Bacteroidetes bacterium]|nr:T9SS type A sorting domain-containing protein [Bacteroidota bacterium]